MSHDDDRIVEFDRLNAVGKVVFVAGSVMKLAGSILDSAVDTVSGIIRETEHAFNQGLDENVEEAKILDDESGSGKSVGQKDEGFSARVNKP